MASVRQEITIGLKNGFSIAFVNPNIVKSSSEVTTYSIDGKIPKREIQLIAEEILLENSKHYQNPIMELALSKLPRSDRPWFSLIYSPQTFFQSEKNSLFTAFIHPWHKGTLWLRQKRPGFSGSLNKRYTTI